MLNLFKSKKSEPSPQDVQNDAFRMQINQLNKALDMYRQTIDNHWGAITKLNKTPAASANYEVMVLEKIQKLETAIKTPPSTSQVRKLFADMADVVMRVSNLEGKKDKAPLDMEKKFNAFLDKYKDGIDNHAMHINALLERVDVLVQEVKLLKAVAKVQPDESKESKQEMTALEKREEFLRKKREYNKKYNAREENREARKRYQKEWSAKQKKKLEAEAKIAEAKQKQRAYYLANKEKVLARLAAAREAKQMKVAQ